MQTETWPIERLVPYVRNPRKNDHAVDRMAASIKEFGFKIPILVRGNGEVVDGHLRLKAARKLGMTEVPVIRCDEWTEAQVKAFRLMVNRSATWAKFDLELVALEMAELKALDFDLKFTGFEPVKINQFLFAEKAKTPDEDVLEPPLEPVTQSGDLWVCGRHRVLCEDSTSEKAVGHLLGGAEPAVMLAESPSVEPDPNRRERAGLGCEPETGTRASDNPVDWNTLCRLFTGPVAYLWHADIEAAAVAQGLETAGFRIQAQIIWVKQHLEAGGWDYRLKHQPCWYAVREGQASNWCGDRTQSTVWEVDKPNAIGGTRQEFASGRGAQKPIDLMRRPILNNSQRGDIVYDPFLGSGTTLIAAEKTDRICYGLDLDPRCVDVIVRRWQKLTGKVAVLEASGRSFDEVARERRPAGVEV